MDLGCNYATHDPNLTEFGSRQNTIRAWGESQKLEREMRNAFKKQEEISKEKVVEAKLA
jgi:hypothetical protein